MSSQRNTPRAEINLLWVRSRGTCAAPGCSETLVEKARSAYVTHGRIAHVFGHSPGGPRWASPISPKWRESLDNLLILCQRHHDMVDGDESAYSAAELFEWKAKHESPDAPHYLDIFRSLRAVPPRRVVPFVNRTEVQRDISTAVAGGRPVAVTGLAGTGKTQVVAEFFREAGDEFTQRLWIKGHAREQIEAELAEVAHGLGVASEDTPAAEAAQSALEALDAIGGYLLVIDGVADVMQVQHLQPRYGTLLVVSQSAAWPGFSHIPVAEMSSPEALELLQESTGLWSHADAEHLARVAELCDGHALVLAQAATYISSTGVSPAHFVDMFMEARTDLLGRVAYPNAATLGASLSMAIDQIGANALQLATVMSFMADEPVPVGVTSEFAGSRPFAFLADRVALEDAIGQLRRFSLVQRQGNLLRMHSLVQEFFRGRANETDASVAYAGASMLVGVNLPRHLDYAVSRRTFRDMVPHVEAVLGRSEEFPQIPQSAAAWLANRLGAFYINNGLVDRGEALLRQGRELAEGHPRGDSIGGSIRHNIANAALERGELEVALEGALEALRLKENELGEGDSREILGYTHVLLGDTYRQMGDIDKAIDHNNLAAEAFLDGSQYGPAAGAVLSVAMVLLDREDRWEESVDHLQRAEELLTRREPAEYVSQKIRLALLWSKYFSMQGEDVRAARSARTAVRLARDDRPESIDLARAYLLQGRMLGRLGEVQAGLGLLGRAERQLAQVADENPIEIEKVRGNIGHEFTNGHCPHCAVRLTSESMDRLEELLPAGHPSLAAATHLRDEALDLQRTSGSRRTHPLCRATHGPRGA